MGGSAPRYFISVYTLSIVALARTKRSKFDSTRTLRDADFWSIDLESRSKPRNRSCVEAVEWTWERNKAGENVVDDKRNLLPSTVSESIRGMKDRQTQSYVVLYW